MALTNAQKQAAWRARRNALAQMALEQLPSAVEQRKDLERVKAENTRLRRELKRLEGLKPISSKPAKLPDGVKVVFCGKVMWPRSDDVTLDDIEAAWWVCKGIISSLATIREPYSADWIARQMRCWNADLSKGSTIHGTRRAIDSCLAAYATSPEAFFTADGMTPPPKSRHR